MHIALKYYLSWSLRFWCPLELRCGGEHLTHPPSSWAEGQTPTVIQGHSLGTGDMPATALGTGGPTARAVVIVLRPQVYGQVEIVNQKVQRLGQVVSLSASLEEMKDVGTEGDRHVAVVWFHDFAHLLSEPYIAGLEPLSIATKTTSHLRAPLPLHPGPLRLANQMH